MDFLDRFDSELVIGLVAPVGAEKSIVIDEIKDSLAAFGYTAVTIKLSDFLKDIQSKHGVELINEPENERLNSYMDAGNKVREDMERGDALALWAASEISRKLRPPEGNEKRAYILDSLKHPKEVESLRRIYGNGFFLIGIYSPEEQRFEYLHRNRNITDIDAKALIERDYKEENQNNVGQQTRETFHVADAFRKFNKSDRSQKTDFQSYGFDFRLSFLNADQRRVCDVSSLYRCASFG